ncbi:hypothetical protein V8G54_016582 [Vigna mungo]|uniref:Uncharacterized protein n=1 Tax=Vigna mungo TaxID=3915 RepID=A0AAQ3NP52_VIGMU
MHLARLKVVIVLGSGGKLAEIGNAVHGSRTSKVRFIARHTWRCGSRTSNYSSFSPQFQLQLSAEKKKRCLEKALSTFAAIISELEKKKHKKKEEQQRLDEEGAAIAEAVALQVLLGEHSDDTCKTWNYNHELELFIGGPRACFADVDGGGTWSFTSRPLENNVYEPLHEEVG